MDTTFLSTPDQVLPYLGPPPLSPPTQDQNIQQGEQIGKSVLTLDGSRK